MREIVNVHVGQCVNQVGNKFTEVICDEHGFNSTGTFVGVSELQLERIEVYFNEATCRKYVPRSILIDLAWNVGDRQVETLWTSLSSNFIYSRTGAGNNYATGYYTEGAELLETALDAIRKEVEMCECMQGFQFVHSVGGGTDSGLGSLLLDTLREDYPDRCIMAWSVMPSKEVSEVVVEPYNGALAVHHLIDGSDLTFCLDNTALRDICKRALKMPLPSTPDLNHLIGLAMAGVTAAFRFPGQLNADIRKLATSMVPFPRLHFFIPGFVPLVPRGDQPHRDLTVPDLIQEMFSYKAQFAACDPRSGSTCRQHASFVVEYPPRKLKKVKVAICDIPNRGYKMCATFFGNNTAIICLWKRLLKQYHTLFHRKAYLHWYLGEGMDEEEFAQTVANLEDLVSEYQIHEANYELPYPNGEELNLPYEEEEGEGG